MDLDVRGGIGGLGGAPHVLRVRLLTGQRERGACLTPSQQPDNPDNQTIETIQAIRHSDSYQDARHVHTRSRVQKWQTNRVAHSDNQQRAP